MNVLDLNKPSKHLALLMCMYFINIQHFRQGYKSQLGNLVIYQVFAAIIKQLNFKYVWGWKDLSKVLRLPANL